MTTSERWKHIRGTRGAFEVSDRGRVRDTHSGRILRPWVSTGGYQWVYLSGPVCKSVHVHRLVGVAFVRGRSTERNCVLHIDNSKFNNRADNLKWGTRPQNTAEAWLDGLHDGSHPSVGKKLGSPSVRVIRRAREYGIGVAFLAECFGVTPTVISAVANRRIWKHVQHGGPLA